VGSLKLTVTALLVHQSIRLISPLSSHPQNRPRASGCNDKQKCVVRTTRRSSIAGHHLRGHLLFKFHRLTSPTAIHQWRIGIPATLTKCFGSRLLPNPCLRVMSTSLRIRARSGGRIGRVVFHCTPRFPDARLYGAREFVFEVNEKPYCKLPYVRFSILHVISS
jgi:hypothetical protein